MEKDSFENQLRQKVLQAELALNQRSDKDKVWSSIQKKQQPRRKLYYVAAAIACIIGIASVFYIKNDEGIITVTKAKKENQVIAHLPKPLAVELAKVNNTRSKIVNQPIAKVKSAESTAPLPNNVAHTEEPLLAVLPEADEVVAVVPKIGNAENKTISTTPSTLVPEFTVQFKRGISIVENANENVIITTLKKFKLKRDTTYFANVVEKQSNKMKLTFKKEN